MDIFARAHKEHHDVLTVPSAWTCRTAYITLQKRTTGRADLPGESFPVVFSWTKLCKMKNEISSQNFILLISYHHTWGLKLPACQPEQLVQVCLGMCKIWIEKKWQHRSHEFAPRMRPKPEHVLPLDAWLESLQKKTWKTRRKGTGKEILTVWEVKRCYNLSKGTTMSFTARISTPDEFMHAFQFK